MSSIFNPAAVQLELIEHQRILANTQTVTFSNLNGDQDGVYLLVCRFRNGSASVANYEVRPNGGTANQSHARIASNGGTPATNSGATMWLSAAPSNGSTVTFAVMQAEKSVARGFTGVAFHSHGFMEVFGSHWNDTTNNITSLDVRATVANGIGANSTLTLYRVKSA
ncbi:MAG: hypothetical protein ACK4RK_10795 [Gemmataceae bacterium]